jgi:hypothetical protein
MNNHLPDNVFEELTLECLMEGIAQILADRTQLTTVKSKLLSDEEIDSILELANDLITPSFRAWHIGRLFALGPDEYLARADKARKYGKNQPAYFSKLLNMR